MSSHFKSLAGTRSCAFLEFEMTPYAPDISRMRSSIRRNSVRGIIMRLVYFYKVEDIAASDATNKRDTENHAKTH